MANPGGEDAPAAASSSSADSASPAANSAAPAANSASPAANSPSPTGARTHQFSAVAFEENLVLRDLLPAFPGARLSPRELRGSDGAATFFLYPFGAIAFHDANAAQRDSVLRRLNAARPGLTTRVVRESFTAREEPGAQVDITDGVLVADRFTPERAGVVALIVAQSAAMEYYERIVSELFEQTSRLVEPLEKRGTVPLATRRLHRFIGHAIATRSEVISVLTLLDKPDATWDDPAMDHIYDDLRAEFDLVDRYAALEQKLRSVQETLELVLDVARDRRMMLLEVFIAALIVVELVLEIWRRAN